MRIAVMGAGAVGGYFGAKLASAGHEVAFIARGKHLDALRAHGLRITSPNGDMAIRSPLCVADGQAVGTVEAILFCVKSYDTETAAQTIRPMVGAGTLIISLQNGIDNADRLARHYPSRQVFPAIVYVGAQIAQPGVIVHSNGGRIIFGTMAGEAEAPALALQKSFVAAGIPCEISTEIEKVQWTKLLWNAPFCAISCLTRANMKQIVESATLTALALDCMAEVQAAARTRNIDLPRQLFDDTIEFSRNLGEFKPSMLQDVEAHKPLEYEAFNGVIVKLLQAAAMPAPINQTFYATLKYLDQTIRTAARG